MEQDRRKVCLFRPMEQDRRKVCPFRPMEQDRRRVLPSPDPWEKYLREGSNSYTITKNSFALYCGVVDDYTKLNPWIYASLLCIPGKRWWVMQIG